MIAEFSIVPLGVGVSVSPRIARVLQIVVDSGISYKANPMGTVLEGEWDEVMEVMRKCHAEVMKDSERAVTSIKIDDRKGKRDWMDKKVESVEQKLGDKAREVERKENGMAKKMEIDLQERVKIQEKALQNLADTLRKREAVVEEEMQDVLEDLKALKVFLTRKEPDFKKQYQEIRKKVKAA